MSISGLSNHLCVVISLLVAPSTSYQARGASTDSHDFTESRQFKKNLSVSKYRDNPHWLRNYTWQPPEKFYGPRNRPTWEVDAVTESQANWKEQKEIEEWEKKMRDVSNRQREKWKTYEAIEDSESKSAKKLRKVTSENQVFRRNATTGDKEVQGNWTDASNGWNENLHNGRWGMSAGNVATAQEFFTDSPRRSEKRNSESPPDEGTTVLPIISNGRWGMSMRKAPKEFTKELSRRSQSLAIPDRVWKQDQDRKSTGDRKIHGGNEAAAAPATSDSPRVFRGLDFPPKELLREISRRCLPGIPEFYRPEAVHQRAHGIAKNNPRERGFMFSQMPGISNIVFLQPFPTTAIAVPTFPNYFMLDPRTWSSPPNYGIGFFSYVIGQSEIPSST